MKKIIIVFLVLLLTACTKEQEETSDCEEGYILHNDECRESNLLGDRVLMNEMEQSFYRLWNETNINEESAGYGLVISRYPSNESMSSIAGVGFALGAIPIGVEMGYITYEEGLNRAQKTLESLKEVPRVHGFYYHFMEFNTGTRYRESEVSIIDTAIFISGAITAGEYFGEDVRELATSIYSEIDWTWYYDNDINRFYMGYDSSEEEHTGHWNNVGEQLMLYVLGAGAPNPAFRTGKLAYDSINKTMQTYKSYDVINSWFGSLFTYQYSHAFIDFRNIEDEDGINWFKNSVNATWANRKYAIDQSDTFRTFGANSWGMTAGDGPSGYSGKYGAAPYGDGTNNPITNDGTITVAGALGSIVYTPNIVSDAALYFDSLDGLKGDYGFNDGYNFEDSENEWFAVDSLVIDKGITVLMLGNYYTEVVWDSFMENIYVQNGLDRIGFNEEVE